MYGSRGIGYWLKHTCFQLKKKESIFYMHKRNILFNNWNCLFISKNLPLKSCTALWGFGAITMKYFPTKKGSWYNKNPLHHYTKAFYPKALIWHCSQCPVYLMECLIIMSQDYSWTQRKPPFVCYYVCFNHGIIFLMGLSPFKASIIGYRGYCQVIHLNFESCISEQMHFL